jgi:hypothetical protein
MAAFYEVTAPRLSYPPLQSVFRRLAADEREHVAHDRAYLEDYFARPSLPAHLVATTRYWWHTLGVVIAVVPLLRALDRHLPLPRGDFRRRLAAQIGAAGMPGSRWLVPDLLARLASA